MFYPHTTLTLTLTPSHPYSSGKKASCLPGILWMGVRFNRQGAKKQLFTDSIAMLHCWCNYAAPLVPECFTLLALPGLLVFLCWTVSIAMLNLWYTYAEPLVYLCWTFGTRMLYSSGTVFSICLQTISRRESEWRNEVRRPKGKPMKNCRPLAD